MEEAIKGWFLSGTHPHLYQASLDDQEVHQGRRSACLSSNKVEQQEQFATLMQQIRADHFLGKRIKLSGFVKTEGVSPSAGLWMRVDSTQENTLQFDNMQDRPIIGDNHWNYYHIVLDIPDNSAAISFGLLLIGGGKVWIDGLKFEEVDKNTPTTNPDKGYHLLEKPTNLDFEAE
ncbi:hypothetical protein JOD18_001122 [Gracilibacillus alcaliphilus]|nr:hypothetical protein [Gracilibacillus alcaliphilus]